MPEGLQDSLRRFRARHPRPERTGLLVMSFSDLEPYRRISSAIRRAFHRHHLELVRADERAYHPTLLGNLRTYLHGCGFGVAIFDRVEDDAFNPNLTLECGYLMALGKPLCVLKDRTIPSLPTDLAGLLHGSLDVSSPADGLNAFVTSWVESYLPRGAGPPTRPPPSAPA